MKPRILSVVQIALLTSLLAGFGETLRAEGGPYQLEYTAQVTRVQHTSPGPPIIETGPLAGGFRLTPTIGPLDWRTFLMERVVFTKVWQSSGEAKPVVMVGTGSYRFGGRGEPHESMNLTLDVNGEEFELASELTAADEDWPALSVLLKGSRWFGPERLDGVELAITLNAVPAGHMVRHRLLPGSTFIDECLVCGRPDIIEPLSGRFDLALIDENMLFSRHAVLDAWFENRNGDAIGRSLHGGGRYSIGGEVILLHPMRLDLAVVGWGTERKARFTNNPAGTFDRWPRISEELWEVDGTPESSFRLHLRSAPVRALWFTASHGMTPGGMLPPGRHLEGGDLLDDSGRVVKPFAELLKPLELKPGTPVKLDAFTVAPEGEVWFSLTEDAESVRLGLIHEGDVVSDRGRRVFTNAELTRNLGFMPVVADLGLDGIQLLSDGEVLFSMRRDQFSESLGAFVQHADIVSAKGTVVYQGKELLAPFQPKLPADEIGLDAFHVWPNGEVWFSTSVSFQSGFPEIGQVMDGDLLSSDGQVIYRNLELVREFQPLEDLANFGLTGVFLVSDLHVTPGAPGLKLTPANGTGAWTVTWSGQGRVFQVEAVSDLRLPSHPRTEIGLDRTIRWQPVGNEFLRVRQW